MFKRLLMLILALLLSGCAQDYPNSIRINEYGSSGQYIPFAEAQIGGVVVYKKGNMNGVSIVYKDGDKVNVTVNGGVK